jgi:hypothetical protein
MPDSNNDQTGLPANRQNESVERRTTQVEETQRLAQDARLREQSFEVKQTETPELRHDKRKRMEMSL